MKAQSKKETNKAGLWLRIRRNWGLYLMLLPALILLFLFSYRPMYGVLISFKEYKAAKGILGSAWADPWFKYMGDSFTNNEFLQQLEAETNVHIEWQVQSLNDWGEQKGIMLAGGELPDIIFGNQTFNDADIMNNSELFMPLDDLIDQYMPNYKKALEEMPDLKKVCTFPDGQMYSMGKNLPLRPKSCNQPIINKQWLDNLNLEVPTNVDELYEVLKAFKEQDANGNGDPNDEIPISGSKGISMDLLNPWGITDLNGYKMLVNEDGSLTYYPTCEAYK